MTSTNNAMINIGRRISFKWATKFGCTCKKNASQGPIGILVHSIMDLKPSPRLSVTMLLSSTFPLPWLAPSIQCGSLSAILPTIIGDLRDSRRVDTNISQP